MQNSQRFTRSPERQTERIEFARSQRKEANEFAQIVWQLVRSSKIRKQKFRCEYPLGPYTLDFVCLNLKLNIEVDGAAHLTDEGIARDRRRDAFLRSKGFVVLRIPGYKVLSEPAKVRELIEAAVDQRMEELGDEN